MVVMPCIEKEIAESLYAVGKELVQFIQKNANFIKNLDI